jgi:hypothetical protein
MTSPTRHSSGTFPLAVARMVMSRSVMAPSTRPVGSQTGKNPMFAMAIFSAAQRMVSSSPTVCTYCFMISAQRMSPPPHLRQDSLPGGGALK